MFLQFRRFVRRSAVNAIYVSVLLAMGPAAADQNDDLIVQASVAVQKHDLATLDRLAASRVEHILWKYIPYWRLSLRLSDSQESAFSEIQDFLKQNEGDVLAQRLRAAWLRRLAKDDERVLFDAEYAKLEQPELDLMCYALQARAQAGDAASLNQLEPLWLELTDTPDTCYPALQALVVYKRKNVDDIWWRFRRLVEAKRMTGAVLALQWLPQDQQPDGALIGQIFSNPGHFLKRTAPRLMKTRSGRELAMAGLVRLARQDALEAHERLLKLGRSRFTAEERKYLFGQLAWMAARDHLPEALGWYRATEGLALTPEQAAWYVRAALRAGNWEAVNAAVTAMPQAQREQPEWIYWLARALQVEGKQEEAFSLYRKCAGQPNFYGLLAQEALGEKLVWAAPAPPPSAQEVDSIGSLAGVQRALALFKLDLRLQGVREWNWALRKAGDRALLAAAEYARRNEIYDRAINTADRTQAEHDFSLRYLAPFYPIFEQQARRNRLDISWVYGLVRQESRFTPMISSSAGAQGLMQIMPATGKYIAKIAGIADYQSASLSKVDTNIMLGTAYMRYVLDKLDNHPVLASAAYNAGPGRARRWCAPGELEGAVYIETIPFDETRDYVKKVMANAAMYAVLFDDKPVSLANMLGKIPPLH